MKAHLIIAILFASSLASGLEAGGFDNWYFDYFSKSVTSSSKFQTPDGKHVETSEGTLQGKLAEDGKAFIQTAKYRYKIQGTKVEATLKWESLDDGSFKGVYKDTNGTTVSYSLILKERKRFEVKSTAPNGAVMISMGNLDDDGAVRSKDKLTAPDGRLIVSIATEMKHALEQKVEQDSADKPATAVESTAEGEEKTKLESEGRAQ
jgi:hypothetical protein